MFVEENSASIYLQGMRDRSMRSGTKFAREIQLTDWSTAGNLSNQSSGVQILPDICTRFRRFRRSRRCSWIINNRNTRTVTVVALTVRAALKQYDQQYNKSLDIRLLINMDVYLYIISLIRKNSSH